MAELVVIHSSLPCHHRCRYTCCCAKSLQHKLSLPHGNARTVLHTSLHILLHYCTSIAVYFEIDAFAHALMPSYHAVRLVLCMLSRQLAYAVVCVGQIVDMRQHVCRQVSAAGQGLGIIRVRRCKRVLPGVWIVTGW